MGFVDVCDVGHDMWYWLCLCDVTFVAAVCVGVGQGGEATQGGSRRHGKWTE